MLNKDLSKQILTIGNRSDKPDGGIAQVLYSYRQHVFPVFKNVVNYKRGNFAYKMLVTAGAYIECFFRLLFDRKIRIVHIHTASDNGFRRNIPFVNLAAAMGRKVVLHIHSGRFNEYYEKHHEQVEKVFAKCAVVVALTKEIKAFYEKMGCRKVVIINNIIEHPEQREIKKDDKAIHLLYLGVITQTKGIYDLIDVIAEHKEEFTGRLVLHVGGNKEVDKLQSLITAHHLENVVKFEGWVSGDKKTELLNQCDVFILPSYTEGVPISILEALSYGKYVVATNVGGVSDIVDEKCGTMLPPQNKEALYKALIDLMEREEYKKNIPYRKEKATAYMPDNVGNQLETLYRDLISGKIVGGGKIS